MSYSRMFVNSIFICLFLQLSENTFGAGEVVFKVPNCQGDLVRPVVQVRGNSLPLNQVFTLEVLTPAEKKNIDLLAFDAVMPAHNHGMVLKPKIFRDKNNAWRIEGVKLHMAGDWQLIFSWQLGASKSKTICKIHI